MEIKHAVEKEDGTYVFQGVLDGPELRFVVEVGINTLVKTGAMPFLVADDKENTIGKIIKTDPDVSH